MPILEVVDAQGNITSRRFLVGASVKTILEGARTRVRTACRGNGTCGLCRIWIESDQVDPATKAELLSLSGEQIAAGMRLACQTILDRDARIRIENPARDTAWRGIPPRQPPRGSAPQAAAENEHRADGSLGMAIDLGTTNLSLCLWDLASSSRLAGLCGANPQLRFGEDVMSRLVAAEESQAVALELKDLVLQAIGDAIREICSGNGLNPWAITDVTIVGNTAELSLLASRNHGLLLQTKYWTSPIECEPTDTAAWAELWNISRGARISLIPPLAGFVGSDLLAGILVMGMHGSEENCLLIDIGTNTEFALWDGSCLWATSASGGPAFEGRGFSCASPAEPGAVYHVERKSRTGHFSFHALPGASAKGLCGSGFVDAIALLLEDGVIDSRGRFVDPRGREAFALMDEDLSISITAGDIDVFQRAKGAIGAGITVLLRMSRIRPESLKKIYLCGSFGSYLDVERAQAVGMLPMVDPSVVELCGNTALAGCESLLVRPGLVQTLDAIRSGARLVNLSFHPDFAEIFMENLFLKTLGDS